MARYPTNSAHRKHRTAVCTVLLPLLLTALLLMLDFPFLTAQGALAVIQERYTFSPGEVIARFGPQQEGMSPLRYCVVRDGDWFTWCSVERDGPLWYPDALTAAHLDGETPPITLTSPAFGGCSQELTAVSGGPNVAVVKADYLSDFDLPLRLKTVRQETPGDQCFFFILENPYRDLPLYASLSACFRVWCYDTDGKLLYEPPYPAHQSGYPILDSHLKVVTP